MLSVSVSVLVECSGIVIFSTQTGPKQKNNKNVLNLLYKPVTPSTPKYKSPAPGASELVI